MLEKKDLKDGAYYEGTCRNAQVAKWDAKTNRFYYRRYKFGETFIEEIFHPDDDKHYDVFIPEKEIGIPETQINF